MNKKEELLHCHLSGAKQSRYWAESLTPLVKTAGDRQPLFRGNDGYVVVVIASRAEIQQVQKLLRWSRGRRANVIESLRSV